MPTRKQTYEALATLEAKFGPDPTIDLLKNSIAELNFLVEGARIGFNKLRKAHTSEMLKQIPEMTRSEINVLLSNIARYMEKENKDGG